ncbi:hypothetical protein I79_024547 [Cricetulus griseus]|uniref:Uncharacterized protein n=1 Tax=Cricetulus griseus TaxID=10029 RepID=G3IKY9_CRIGR|nr:hypothetical protein I79_024547 [Cricetulus griseus]
MPRPLPGPTEQSLQMGQTLPFFLNPQEIPRTASILGQEQVQGPEAEQPLSKQSNMAAAQWPRGWATQDEVSRVAEHQVV